MQYKCQECNDTGGRDKIGAYFDCNACDTAAIRRDLNDFVKSLTQRSTYPTHPEDVALAIHQRALAMAPKQEAPAGWKLVPEDPTGDMFHAAAKIDNEMFAGGSSHGAEDGQVWAAMYDAAPKAPIAAPAAANGAQYLTRIADFLADAVGGYSGGLADRIEEVIKQLRLDAGCGACGDACKGMTCRLQDESPSAVAAGSDAALVDAKHLVDITTAIMSQHGLIDHLSIGATQAFCDDLCAALSGAKGN